MFSLCFPYDLLMFSLCFPYVFLMISLYFPYVFLMFSLGPMCRGRCAGADVLGPMCWGPCAGAHVLGPMCSWTSPARNICDEKSDEKVKFCRRLPKYRPHRELYAPSKVPPRCPPPSEKGHFSQGVFFTRPHSPVGTTIAVSKKVDYGHADNLSTLRLVRLLFRFPRTPKPYRDAPLPPNTRIKKGVGKREFRFDFFGTASEILKNSSSSATCVFLKTQVYHCFGGEGGFRYSFAAILSKKNVLKYPHVRRPFFVFTVFFCMKNVARV